VRIQGEFKEEYLKGEEKVIQYQDRAHEKVRFSLSNFPIWNNEKRGRLATLIVEMGKEGEVCERQKRSEEWGEGDNVLRRKQQRFTKE